jgi:hypothetical protein
MLDASLLREVMHDAIALVDDLRRGAIGDGGNRAAATTSCDFRNTGTADRRRQRFGKDCRLVRKGYFPEGSKVRYAHLGGAPALDVTGH